MENKPLLSIVVPLYNTTDYIGRCIESVINQEYDNWELIIVDDGSTDNSLEIASNYARNDKRIKVIHQENQGVSKARNTALKEVQGELVTFIDSDDSIEPCTYRVAIDLLFKEKECDHVQFCQRRLVGTDRAFSEPNSHSPIIGTINLLKNWIVEEDVSWIVCNKIFKVELIKGFDFKEGSVYEDNLYVCELLKRSKGICFSEEGAYLYHYRANSITNTHTTKNTLDMITIHTDIYREIDEYPELNRERTHIAYLVANDMFASLRSYKGENPIVEAGKPLMRQVRMLKVLSETSLDLRKRLKVIGMKLYAHLF